MTTDMMTADRNNSHHCTGTIVWIACFVLGLPVLLISAWAAEPHSFKNCPCEPSGLIRLSEGQFLVIEDEDKKKEKMPLWLLTRQGESGFGLFEVTKPDHWKTMDDLEGMARSPDGWIYLVTSHSRKQDKEGKVTLKKKRQRLARLKFRQGTVEIVQFAEEEQLRKAITALDPKRLGLNPAQPNGRDPFQIESLAWDVTRDALLLGLRSPVDPNKGALVLPLLNPEHFFSHQKPSLAEPIFLPLGGDGIRGMTYDACLGGMLLIAGPEKGRSHLWFWPVSGGEPQLLASELPGNPEGVSVDGWRSKRQILLMSDEGNVEKQHPGAYQWLNYDWLKEAAEEALHQRISLCAATPLPREPSAQ
jgi:hypothetical protein